MPLQPPPRTALAWAKKSREPLCNKLLPGPQLCFLRLASPYGVPCSLRLIVIATLFATSCMAETLTPATAARFADLALACIHREYPTKIGHVLNSDLDVKKARDLTPAFYGCYDWHSSVHGHWLLARLARTFPDAPFASRVKSALGKSLTTDNLQREADYLKGEGRASFERPYGLAWFLQLVAELRGWKDAEADRWAANAKPLEDIAVARLRQWLPKLSHPVRSGEHGQTAFSFGLILDYARSTGNRELAALLESKIREFYLKDRDCPLAYEPSGEDFLSPCLAEADVVRRVLPPPEFAAWLSGFLPSVSLEPEVVTDPTDGRLAHLDGLNLSRAWMLRGIVAALPKGDSRQSSLGAIADAHARAGLRSVTGEHYEGAHWLATFAVYLLK